MIYKNYIIEEDNTGIAPANSRFSFYKNGDEKVRGFGKDVQECIEQINGTDTELETLERIIKAFDLLILSLWFIAIFGITYLLISFL